MEHEKTKFDNEEELAAATKVLNGFSVVEKNNSDEQSPSFSLKLITWNIDGLSSENLKVRTEAVCRIIEREQADIVCLQEIVPETADYISERMSNYHCHFAAKDKEDETTEEDEQNEENEEEENEKLLKRENYFVGTLLRKSSISFISKEVINFPFSKMSRNLLKISVIYKDLPICVLNSHVETLSKSSEERKNQLRIIFKSMIDVPENETVIFGGDTSLRETELPELGNLPNGIEDVWVACGSQKRCAYTFDMSENDNLRLNWKYKPRCRYDRVYIRRSSPSKLKPSSFKLIGLERLSHHGCFPSDHFGILCNFEKDDFKFKLGEAFSENSDEVPILQPFWIKKPQ